MSAHEATVEVLTAEVRVLMVGSRQVTMSVYNQLDEVQYDEIEPFGRVRPRDAKWTHVYAVGRAEDGTLVRSSMFTWDMIRDPSLREVADATVNRQQRSEMDVAELVAAVDAPNTFVSPGVRSGYEQYRQSCRHELARRAALRDWLEGRAHWDDLPLIVLAGLR